MRTLYGAVTSDGVVVHLPSLPSVVGPRCSTERCPRGRTPPRRIRAQVPDDWPPRRCRGRGNRRCGHRHDRRYCRCREQRCHVAADDREHCSDPASYAPRARDECVHELPSVRFVSGWVAIGARETWPPRRPSRLAGPAPRHHRRERSHGRLRARSTALPPLRTTTRPPNRAPQHCYNKANIAVNGVVIEQVWPAAPPRAVRSASCRS